MNRYIEIFASLGQALTNFGKEARSRAVIAEAESENGWFTATDICRAIEAIRVQMLNPDLLREWLDAYKVEPHAPKRIGLILAGNIPAVGFFDLLCVVASGNTALVKLSSKDRVVMHYIISLLQQIEPNIAIEEWDAATTVDAIIATGGESANLHFRTTYNAIPHLLRGSRHSVAIIRGDEGKSQLSKLATDIFAYSGLGCRNVSLIFAPEGYNLTITPPDLCRGYRNNYRQTRALLTMRGERFIDLGSAVMVECEASFPREISRINIARYNSLDEVEQWLEANDRQLQCVVGSRLNHPRGVEFGQAQYPRLVDYADGVDVMEFLLSLH